MVKKGQGSFAGGETQKPDRKTVERNRRIQMKGLCSNLVSLIPSSHFVPPKELLSQRDQIEQAADYIKLLRGRVEELRKRKTNATSGGDHRKDASINGSIRGGSELPILKITDLGSNVEVVLISGPSKNFMTHQVISILDEEGANVVNFTLCNNGDRIVHTFHAEVKFSRVGVDVSRLCQRIEELIS